MEEHFKNEIFSRNCGERTNVTKWKTKKSKENVAEQQYNEVSNYNGPNNLTLRH